MLYKRCISSLTFMFGSVIVIITLVLEMTGRAKFAKTWTVFSGCSLMTAFVFSIGIALALRAGAGQNVLEQQDTVLSEEV